MGAGPSWRVVGRAGLTPGEVGEVRRLAAICNAADGLDLKLSWELIEARAPGQASDFCAYDGDAIVGYAALDGAIQERELTGMVHPDHRRRGIFTALVAAAREECRRRGTRELLLVCERSSASGKAFVAAIGGRSQFAEYHLTLDAHDGDAHDGLPPGDDEVTVQLVGAVDLERLVQLYARSFDEPLDQLRERVRRHDGEPGSRHYIASRGNEPFGTVGALNEAGQVYLRGVSIVPERRGRGYGRPMLVAALHALRAEGHARFALDVESDNVPALALYRACGFREASVYEYYEVPLT